MKSSLPPAEGKSAQDEVRKTRLAEQLRANLQRRKAQARSRRSGSADSRPDGLPGAAGRGEDEAG